MNPIEKITIGIDWEIPINSAKTGMSASGKKLERIIEKANLRLPELEIGDDIDLLEIRPGMLKSFAEFREKTKLAFETCVKIAKREGVVLVPIGYREADQNPAGGHIHAGSLTSFADIAELHNRMMPFVPALIAIMSSSPSADGNYRSLRMKHNAHSCSNPMTFMKPEHSLERWGTDVCIKYPYKPTLEFRAADSQPTPAMMVEMGALYLGLAVGLSRLKKPPFAANILEYGLNRMNAVRNGMRATFRFGDSEITASEIVLEHILPLAAESLDTFGAPDGPFGIIEKMAKSRISVSDWIEKIIPAGIDRIRASGEMTRAYISGVDPVGWLVSQGRRKALPYEDPDNELLDAVGIGTPLGHIYTSLPLPRAFVEKLVSKMVEKGKLRTGFGPKNDIFLDRIDLL